MRRVWEGWTQWAFGPVDTAPMAALRIAVGLLSAGWAISLMPDAATFLGDTGLQPDLPAQPRGHWAVQLWHPYLVLVILLVAACALILGWHTRVAAVVVFVLLLAIQRRDPWILNSGDVLLRGLAFFVMLMPAGETWSLDARRRRGMERKRAPWALRLLQLQISALYFFSVWAKVRGIAWNDGTAVGIALQLEDLQRFAVPAALATSLLFSTILTYSSLLIEAALAIGLWLPRMRYPVMAAGAGLHLGIEATLLIGWFSLAVMSSYLAFVQPQHLRAAVGRLQKAYARRVARRMPTGAPPGAQEQARSRRGRRGRTRDRSSSEDGDPPG